ncbi:glycosyl transferase [Shouchella clausii]|uniref:glycosyltransferase n=1 Tax=Shouchella tritolerans TaxID=2979466 RepID=UPI001B1587E2|nr:glycosyltransferase [Shouchella tritolerans]GIN12687.1 glycosyl transferase [Shouchella clausii]
MKKNIVFLSHTFIGGPFVVGSHHLAKELARQGHKVLHISTPLTLLHLFKKDEITSLKRSKKDSLEKITDNCYQLIPSSYGLPWKISGEIYKKTKINLLTKPTEKIVKKSIKSVFDNQVIDYLLIDQPTMIGLENIIPSKKIIYRATDIYSEMLSDPNIVKAEIDLLEKSDAMIGTSPTVSSYLKSLDGELPLLTLENAADLNLFKSKTKKPNYYVGMESPIMVYVGALDRRFDFQTIYWIASNLKSINIVLIGPLVESKEVECLSELSNVYIMGPIQYEKIPSYLQHADIAILPLSDHPSNKGRSPMKLYEYLASGLPIVCKAVDDLKKRQLKHVYFYEESEEILELIPELLNKKTDKDTIKNSFGEVSWENNTRKLMSFISDL